MGGFLHDFSGIKISKSTVELGGARVLASLRPAKGTDFYSDVVGGNDAVLRHSDPRLEQLTRTFAPPGLAQLSPIF